MNTLIRSLRSSLIISNVVVNNFTRNISMAPVYRSMWFATKKVDQIRPFNVRLAHSSVEKELQQFLDNEIKSEEQTSDKTNLPKTFEGFKVSADGAEVELTKETSDETIAIKFNINHSVTEEETEGVDKVALRSKPDFEIDVTRGDVILGFNCSYANNFDNTELDEANDEVFHIDEVTIYENKYSDNKYALAGDTLDADLYDLLKTFLAEKGISNTFIENISDLSTQYEQKVYIKFLNDLRKFF
ncbi:complement component 1 Q subcomponent-binding protein, mitochondrial [Rhopalosiphum maidis]|uniref:complement component 1 Q subcomponent-binding protein, mitochondrial n=1 Tax=Rhopalosiphum maidis TaxID=43146 RepID=UPI000EFEB9A3|nr:complement component 1 Q subcomponent-binding protein, mitochondrial [Rhopalosiphum maidis]